MLQFILLQHLFYFIAHETTPLDNVSDVRFVKLYICGEQHGILC